MSGGLKIIYILISSILVNNFVLSRFLGICPFLGVSRRVETALGMGMSVTFVMALASLITYFAQYYVLVPLNLAYLQTIVFILVIASLVQLVETILKKYIPALYTALGVYLPLITTNCAVLAVTIANIGEEFSFIESLINALGSGLGFFLAMVIFSGVRGQIESSEPPKSFDGLPITLISAAIISLSFFGFTGVIENLFG